MKILNATRTKEFYIEAFQLTCVNHLHEYMQYSKQWLNEFKCIWRLEWSEIYITLTPLHVLTLTNSTLTQISLLACYSRSLGKWLKVNGYHSVKITISTFLWINLHTRFSQHTLITAHLMILRRIISLTHSQEKI